MQALHNREHKSYIDEQPELQEILRGWLASLDLDSHSVAHGAPDLEEIECRGRDGFIPYRHNRGGFDLQYMSDVGTCAGCGCGPNLTEIERSEQKAYTEAKLWLKENYASELADVPDEKINYHELCELGKGKLAEELSEAETEWMDETVWWGVRAMYEGRDSAGVHTLMIYCSGNVSGYYGLCGQGSQTLAEFEIRFRTASGLRRRLAQLTAKVQNAF